MHNDRKVFLINTSSSAILIHDEPNINRAGPVAVQQTSITNVRPKPIFLDKEFINSVMPDVIFVVDRSKTIDKQGIAKNYFEQEVLNKTKTNVIYLSSDLWYLSSGGAESLDRQIDEAINNLK